MTVERPLRGISLGANDVVSLYDRYDDCLEVLGRSLNVSSIPQMAMNYVETPHNVVVLRELQTLRITDGGFNVRYDRAELDSRRAVGVYEPAEAEYEELGRFKSVSEAVAALSTDSFSTETVILLAEIGELPDLIDEVGVDVKADVEAKS